jgi:flavocytochrome c
VEKGATQVQAATSVIIATGGYASKPDSKDSLLAQHRPDLLNFATTNGRWAVGDGISLASVVGAKLVDMESIQVHPTAFIDQRKPDAGVKTLCAEILRGSGAVLVGPDGERFVNELEKRDYVTKHMVDRSKNLTMANPNFFIVLNAAGAAVANKHITMYTHKGLLTQYASLDALAEAQQIPLSKLQNTFAEYDRVAAANESVDAFGKKYFHNTPLSIGPFYAGVVTPALHYSMGGLAINAEANVLNQETGKPIPGLYAAGEVVGGIHGTNRLGGNAMTECAVFGIIAARSTIAQLSGTVEQPAAAAQVVEEPAPAATSSVITLDQLKHNNGENGAPLWAAIHGQVYDLTEFADEHPAGPEPIFKAAGTDATEMFDEIHSIEMLDDFEPIGKYASA